MASGRHARFSPWAPHLGDAQLRDSAAAPSLPPIVLYTVPCVVLPNALAFAVAIGEFGQSYGCVDRAVPVPGSARCGGAHPSRRQRDASRRDSMLVTTTS